MSKASENRIAGYFKPERQERVRTLLQQLQTELAGIPDLTEQDTRQYFKVSEEEKRLMRERFPRIAQHSATYAPQKFNPQDILDDLDDGDFLDFLATTLDAMRNRSLRARVVAFGEAYRNYSKFVGYVEEATEDREAGAAELLSQLRITTSRKEGQAKTRRENRQKHLSAQT